jgi:hypothetical protein
MPLQHAVNCSRWRKAACCELLRFPQKRFAVRSTGGPKQVTLLSNLLWTFVRVPGSGLRKVPVACWQAVAVSAYVVQPMVQIFDVWVR